VIVRLRTEGDLDACERIARATHELDNYPVYLPGDLRSFLASPDAIAAWVAEVGGDVVGHVALHRRSTGPVMDLAREVTGLPADRLGFAARLVVDPGTRRVGVGRTLLKTAASEATRRGLQPVLDVVTQHQSAIRLYENAGWILAGKVALQLGDLPQLEELVYLGPPGAPG
jgi:GNAT superfamily N-acetyltransferase